MANEMFVYNGCVFKGQEEQNIPRDVQNGGSRNQYEGADAWSKSIDALCTDLGFFQENTGEGGLTSSRYHYQQWQQSFSEYSLLDDVHFTPASPSMQHYLDGISKMNQIPGDKKKAEELKKDKKKQTILPSLELLNSYGNGFKRLNGDKTSQKPISNVPRPDAGARELSVGEIFKMAGEKFIQSNSQGVYDLSSYSHPYGYYFSDLSEEVIKEIDLVEFLLFAADSIGLQEFEYASKLLNRCDLLSSQNGSTIQKVVYYFSEALREKIARENGTSVTLKGAEKKTNYDIDVTLNVYTPVSISCHQGIPFCQILQFAGVEAIVENVRVAKKIHIVDFGLRVGLQWIVLMQALAVRSECPVEHLKVTVVTKAAKPTIEDTGNRLSSFAQSMDIPFSFRIVSIEDMQDLKQHNFELEDDESLAVYMPFLLMTLLNKPAHLDRLMLLIKSISPCVVVVSEIEANHNSPVFVDRFIEGLFFYGAYYDCLAYTLDQDDPAKGFMESVYFGEAIKNLVAYEGDERFIRHVNLDVWRAFFTRFRLMEVQLSVSSLYQATLLLKKFPAGGSCTLDMNGKSLITGWKGTPLNSLSVWKFT